MMEGFIVPLNATNPARAGDAVTGLGDAFPGGNCSSSITPNPREKQAPSAASAGAIAALQRDFIAECLRVVALKASHAADDIELGDDLCAERGISIIIAHVKQAGSTFREMQKARGEQ